ncbi:MAG: lipooligosaccharide transport system permease protein [Actinomycetota bacterium]
MKVADLLPSGPLRVLERNALAYRRLWLIFAVGIFEPFLFLLSIGIGVGDLVGKIAAPGGELVSYRDFVAPGLMATAAMNGAVFDTTIMFFIKLKYWKVFDSMLATPLRPADIVEGEVAWAITRGVIYASFFFAAMIALGLVHSWQGVLLLPSAALVCWAFAGVGAAGAAYMRSYFDFDFVNVAVIPSFLFSGVFFELDRYPGWLATVVQCTPLYQGVALMRDLSFGQAGIVALGHAAYLAIMGAVGVRIATTKMVRRLTP